jgi:hypothetical protein
MEYSSYPVRAIEEQERLMLQGMEKLLDLWGYDKTQNLKPETPIDQAMEGAEHDTE